MMALMEENQKFLWKLQGDFPLCGLDLFIWPNNKIKADDQ